MRIFNKIFFLEERCNFLLTMWSILLRCYSLKAQFIIRLDMFSLCAYCIRLLEVWIFFRPSKNCPSLEKVFPERLPLLPEMSRVNG